MEGPRRFCYALVCCAAVVSHSRLAFSQEPVEWLTDLNAARQLAAQSGRLVLVHVWAPWCGPCQQMERDVLTNPTVKASLAPRFVLVKLDYDAHAAELQNFNIDLLPSDVLLTPDGRVLNKSRGKLDATTYVSRLAQLSEQHTTPLVARAPGATASNSPLPQAVPTTGPLPAQPAPMALTEPAPMAGESPPPAATTPMQGAGFPGAGAPAGQPALGLDGYCPVRLCQTRTWVAGDPQLALVFEGRVYRFAGMQEMQAFQSEPSRYAPVAGGLDTVLMSEQRGAHAGRREHGVFWHGQIYLFTSEESLARFAQSPRAYAAALRQAQLQGPGAPIAR